MKNALISPNEQIGNGYRIAEVAVTTFEVANPLFWMECADEVVPDLYYYDLTDNSIKIAPVYVSNITPIGGEPNVIA